MTRSKSPLETWLSCLFDLISKVQRHNFMVNHHSISTSNLASADEVDIIDEALMYFKPNIFFREYDINGGADRTLIYLFLYITECLKRLYKVSILYVQITMILQAPKKSQAVKDLTTMALESKLPIPGESSFPFAGLYKPPANAQEEGTLCWLFNTCYLETMRAYLQQLRQEVSVRLIEQVYKGSDEPSKVSISRSLCEHSF